VSSPSSSVQQGRQALGTRLRELRIDAGLTARELGKLMGRHGSKVSRIEHGRAVPSAADIQAWCAHCGAPDQTADLVARLRAVEGMYTEWRRIERTGLRVSNEVERPLWERTRRFRIYANFLIPGPVQTEAYVRAVLRSIAIRGNLPDDVEETVRVRLDRQHVVRDGDHRFAIIIEESALHSPIGGAEAMAAQLGHLLEASAMPSVSLGVIPFGTDRTGMWPAEIFWMFDDAQVAVELVSAYLCITQPHEIAVYGRAFDRLAGQAVYGAAARTLIADAIKALAVED
jgi:transcriptional regulator with XRE-family HTH domain